MKNTKKGLIIVGVILALTLGISLIRLLFFAPSGMYFGSIIDVILLGPALPFLTLVWLYPNSITAVSIMSFILATVFWLLVGYGIGKWMDNKNK